MRLPHIQKWIGVSVFGVLVFGPSGMMRAQISAPVQRTARHEVIRTMAAELIHDGKHQPDCARKPVFYTCKDGHLHWSLGDHGISTESFVMDQRLRIEWFLKYLSRQGRRFWIPYLREVDSELDRFIRSTNFQETDALFDREEEFRKSIEKIYMKGVDAYALASNTEPRKEPIEMPCGAAADVVVVLTTNVRGIRAIKWIDAGTVWLKVSLTGQEPEYHTYAVGSRVEVAPGGIYYYKLVMRGGRHTERQLAPKITDDEDRIVLAWR